MQRPATVDLAAYRAGRDRATTAAALCASLRSTGFVVVTGHGIPEALVERAQRDFVAFFSLPETVRASYGGRAGGQRGYTPFGVERAVGHPVPDRKEFFHVGPPTPAPRADRPDNVWPSEIPALRDTCTNLFASLEACAFDLLGAIALGCGLPSAALSDLLRDGNHVLRAAWYPARTADADARALRAAPHEDINLITLLCGATDAGLEIRGSEGRWSPVEAPPGAIVADAGDMLARITNDDIPATTHRVVDPPDGARRARLSLPFFAHPRSDCELRVLAPFTGPGRPPRHPPITAGAFLEERLHEIGLLAPGR